MLLCLLITRVLPLAIANRWYAFKSQRQPQDLQINIVQNHDSVTIGLNGDAVGRWVPRVIACFRETLTARNQAVVFDLSATRVIDARFFGLLLMLRKCLKGQGAKLSFVRVDARAPEDVLAQWARFPAYHRVKMMLSANLLSWVGLR